MTIDIEKLEALAKTSVGVADISLAPDVVLEVIERISAAKAETSVLAAKLKEIQDRDKLCPCGKKECLIHAWPPRRISDLARVEAENETLRKKLLEASEEIAAWGAYASGYFQEKHDLAGCVAKFHDAAMVQER